MIYMFKAGDVITGKPGFNQEFGTFVINRVSGMYLEASCITSENSRLFTVYDNYIIDTDRMQLLNFKSINIKNSLNFIVSLVKS